MSDTTRVGSRASSIAEPVDTVAPRTASPDIATVNPDLDNPQMVAEMGPQTAPKPAPRARRVKVAKQAVEPTTPADDSEAPAAKPRRVRDQPDGELLYTKRVRKVTEKAAAASEGEPAKK